LCLQEDETGALDLGNGFKIGPTGMKAFLDDDAAAGEAGAGGSGSGPIPGGTGGLQLPSFATNRRPTNIKNEIILLDSLGRGEWWS